MLKKLLLLALLFSGLLTGLETASAQTNSATDAAKPEMKTYYLVLLKSGPNRNHSKEEAEKIQAAHMAHIRKMADDGKLSIAGPFLDNTDLRGIFIFNVASMEEAKALTDADPAVKAGRLVMEIHPWMSQKGASLK